MAHCDFGPGRRMRNIATSMPVCLYVRLHNAVVSCAVVACNFCVKNATIIAGFPTELHAIIAQETTS